MPNNSDRAHTDVVIRAHDLTKVYHLYERPVDRFLDMFGLLKNRTAKCTEHAALSSVSLEICRGEKVAIIGRNGAGKSTFLRLITGVVEPTAGALTVNGQVQALLQIGTGFHPDFSGRQNVLAYLAQLGIAGSRAEQMLADIIEFAELEEYIDQPVKTYSTGMGVRLMFSASTAISPDLLVLDEVLGVGDAYFSQKSYERIQELCSGAGTTLLLVTHDVYSAAKVCSRFIWLDHGRVMMDGTSQDVVKAYELSIRAQEEHRLRAKRVSALQRQTRTRVAYGQVRCAHGEPPAETLLISDIRLMVGGEERALLSFDPGAASRGVTVADAAGEGNWGRVEEREGRAAREFLPHGSIFHRLPFIVNDAHLIDDIEAGRARFELGAWSASADAQQLDVSVFSNDGRTPYSTVVTVPPGSLWARASGELVEGGRALAPASGMARYGGRSFEVTDVAFADAQGTEAMHFVVGSTLRVRLAYRINDPAFDECPTLVLAFQKDGTVRSHRFWTRGIRFRAADSTGGRIEVVACPLLLGAGTYTVTVSAFKEGYFESRSRHLFFAGNAGVLDMHARGYEVVVQESPNVLCNDVIFQHPAEWLVDGHSVARTEIVADQPAGLDSAGA